MSALGKPQRLAAPLAELLDVVQREVISGQVQQTVEQRRTMSGREHEEVAIEPMRVARVVLEPRIIRSRDRIHLCLAALPEPVPCSILTREIEMLHLRVDKMVCNVRHDARDSTIRDDRNFLDPLNMLLEELQVSKHRAKVFPAGK